MLPKKNRANTKQIEKLFKNKGFLSYLTFSFRYFKMSIPGMDSGTESRISFIVPKKVAKSAVLRNKLRRIGYISLEKHFKLLPFPITGVFTFNKNNTNQTEIHNEIRDIFKKITN